MIQFDAAIHQAVNSALTDRAPMFIATVDASGQPNVTFRGSLQTHGDDHLAYWSRTPAGRSAEAMRANPRVAVVYQNLATRTGYQFHGRARLVTDAATARQIYDASPELERQQDPDRKGAAFLIAIDRIIVRGQVVQER